MHTVTKQRPSTIFNHLFNGQANFMTPNVISYHVKQGGRRVAELSSGEGLFNRLDTILGVTVLDYSDGQWRHNRDLCRCFQDQDDAKNYIATL